MASGRGGSLGLLTWLLLLQPGLCEAWAPPLSPAPPLPWGSGGEPGARLRAPPPPGLPGSPRVLKTAGSAAPLDWVAFTPGNSYSYEAASQSTSPMWPMKTREVASGCGHRSTRIVGGRPAPEKKWPWQVSLQTQNNHICGGSLIANLWVMTAAHCIYGHLDYIVKLGDTHVHHRKPTAVSIPVRDIVIHQYYSGFGSIVNDIALALLSFPVNYSTHIQPVCLPEKSFMVKEDTVCWVTGWGKLRETDSSELAPVELQEAEQKIIRYEKCNEILRKNAASRSTWVRKGTVCGYSEEGKDTCQGDSGGPMVCEFNETWVQVGIVSWGFGCGRKGFPGVYTEVSFYKDWVTGHLSQASCWDSGGFLVLSLCLVLHLGILASP